jgi:hypothetical protein
MSRRWFRRKAVSFRSAVIDFDDGAGRTEIGDVAIPANGWVKAQMPVNDGTIEDLLPPVRYRAELSAIATEPGSVARGTGCIESDVANGGIGAYE